MPFTFALASSKVLTIGSAEYNIRIQLHKTYFIYFRNNLSRDIKIDT